MDYPCSCGTEVPCKCDERILCIKLDVKEKTKFHMNLMFSRVNNIKWNRWNIILQEENGFRRVFLNTNEQLTSEDKYLFTREEMLEWLLAYYSN
jgi:hypothetical protein